MYEYIENHSPWANLLVACQAKTTVARMRGDAAEWASRLRSTRNVGVVKANFSQLY